MKQSIVWTMVCLMMLTLAGCGGNDPDEPVKKKDKAPKKKERIMMNEPADTGAVAVIAVRNDFA